MKGDYLAEFAAGDAECKAAQDARVACAENIKIAEKDLVLTHPMCMSLTLNFSVSRYSFLQISDEGCKMARVAFKNAISESVSVEVPQLQFIVKVRDTNVLEQRQIQMDPTVQKNMDTTQLQLIDKVVDVPVVLVVRVPQV